MSSVDEPNTSHTTGLSGRSANDANDKVTAEEPEDGNLGGVPVQVEHVTSSSKKKKKHRPRSQRGLGKPTGFEPYHADGPLRPEDAKEDEEIYSKDFPFINRILTSIQRFERTRKLTPERRDAFYKYLAYGGIDVGPSMFQSVAAFDKVARESMSRTELAVAMSQLSISDDKYDTDSPSALYAVDFEGCMKAFLSRRAKTGWGFETRESVEIVTTTLERFMDYLLQHNVCPEYKAQVLATRDFCREASTELWEMSEASRRMPGDFNIACSTLFGGQYGRDYDGATDWGPEQQGQATFVGMTPDVAEQVIKFGVAGAATEDVYELFQARDSAENYEDRVKVVETKNNVGFEVISIIPPSKECITLYKTQSQGFRPVGRACARLWRNPDAPPEDLTNEEKQAMAKRGSGSGSANSDEEYIFFIESVILKNLYIGSKIEATIHKMNCGIWFFDEFINAFPSFDTYICNEMIMGWKEPKWHEGSVEYEKQNELQQEENKNNMYSEQVEGNPVAADGAGVEADGEEDVPEVVAEDVEPY